MQPDIRNIQSLKEARNTQAKYPDDCIVVDIVESIENYFDEFQCRCPVNAIQCEEETLKQLINDINEQLIRNSNHYNSEYYFLFKYKILKNTSLPNEPKFGYDFEGMEISPLTTDVLLGKTESLLDGIILRASEGKNVFDIITRLIHANSHDYVIRLLERGVDCNMRSQYGSSLLHVACASGGVELIRYLISIGADVNAKTKDGENPLHFTLGLLPMNDDDRKRDNDVLIVQLLAESGATVDVDKYWQQVKMSHKHLGITEEEFADGIVFARDKIEVEEILRQAGILKDRRITKRFPG